MSKRELIDEIRRHNRTAAPEFLALFGETDLKAYLDRVCAVTPPKKGGLRPTVQTSHQLVMA